MRVMKKKEVVTIEVVAESSCGILIDGEFVGNGEILEADEQTAQDLIRRGRAKRYEKTSSKKKDEK